MISINGHLRGTLNHILTLKYMQNYYNLSPESKNRHIPPPFHQEIAKLLSCSANLINTAWRLLRAMGEGHATEWELLRNSIFMGYTTSTR